MALNGSFMERRKSSDLPGGGDGRQEHANGWRTLATGHFQCRRALIRADSANQENPMKLGVLQILAQSRNSLVTSALS